MHQVLQVALGIRKCGRLLQSVSGITNSDSYYKLRRITGMKKEVNATVFF